MKKTNKVIIISVIVAVLLLGIGYAAIQNITLNIAGTAAANPSQSNFKVMFSGAPVVSDSTYVTAAITDDTNATINVEGLTKKGDVVTATYTVQNASEDLSADLAVSTTNDNTEYFSLSSEIAQTSLIAGEATTLTVTAELTKTPIKDSVSATIGVQLEAMPVQPGEEGTSEGINDFSQTPDYRNEYGFYYDKFYANQDEGFGFIAHEDGSVEMFAYILSGEIDGLATDEWICVDYIHAGEVDFDEMKSDEVTISKDGKIVNIYGADLEILDIDFRGLYYGCEYSAIVDGAEFVLVIKENGTTKITVYENGCVGEEGEVDNFLEPIANDYLMLYNGEIFGMTNATGELFFISTMNTPFTLKEKHNYVSEEIKNATCIEDGEINYSCTICNKSYTTILKATNHKNDVDNNGICDDCEETITYTDFEVDSYNRKKIGYSDSITELVIPATFYEEITRTWYKVTSIESEAFQDCSNLTSVVIPMGVTTIGDYAFRFCENLKAINVDSNNINYCSKDGILYNKDMTTLVKYPAGKTGNIFTIPEEVNTIGYHAFNDCLNLTNVIIPDGVTSIEPYAFGYCPSLTTVNYTGTEEQWNAIQIGTSNTYLTDATINYNYVVPTE